MPSADPHRVALLQVFRAALAAVHGAHRVREYLRMQPLQSPVYLIAIGKAACAMAGGAHECLGAAIREALVIAKHGYAEPLPFPVLEAAHPVPDETSLDAGEQLARFIGAMPPDARVLVLLSGGGSALVERLPRGVSLGQWRELNRWLLASGLDIVAMNHIRKRVSLIKGGRLAAMLAPRPVVCLAISDVPGDDPGAIASGPLVAEVAPALPDHALPPLIRGLLNAAPAMPAPGDSCFRHVRVALVGTLSDALDAATVAARDLGYEPVRSREFISGDAIETGRRLAAELLAAPPRRLCIWGGETTIRLPAAPGRGGRNQSLALAAATALAGTGDVLFFAAGTDGTDGPTEDAGALVDAATVARGRDAGFDPERALAQADAGTLLEASGDLIQTGPTGTNVMDIILGLRY